MTVFALLKLPPSLPPLNPSEAAITSGYFFLYFISDAITSGYFYFLSSRSILAALHFNYNLKRDVKLDAERQPRQRVTFPKYKEGEGTVREARVPANYGN